jgi:Uma2 family endonuclease
LIIRDSLALGAVKFLHTSELYQHDRARNPAGTALASSSSRRRYNADMEESDPMAPTVHPDRRLTYDDFLLFPDDGLRHEVIDGVHYVTAAPSLRHQDLIGRLYLALGNFLAGHPSLGRAFLSPVDVIFTIHDIVEPDLVFVAADQLAIMTEKNIQGAPAIVVEVVSKSTRRRDERIKKGLFDRGDVREYWIVDPDRSHIIVYRRNDAGFTALTPVTAAGDALLTSPLLPGFSLSVSELFRPSI